MIDHKIQSGNSFYFVTGQVDFREFSKVYQIFDVRYFIACQFEVYQVDRYVFIYNFNVIICYLQML